MHPWQKSYRSVYLDTETDRALETRAQAEGVGKPMLIVAYIEQGLCLPEAALMGGEPAQDAEAWSDPPGPKVLRSIYVDSGLSLQLASRAEGEKISANQLIRRFCAEGLARPSSQGRILRRTQEAFVAQQKAKIAHLWQAAEKAYAEALEAQEAFKTGCPHLRLPGTLPLATCEDCGAIVTRSK